jgi:methionyl-tRNA synthetase
MARGMHAALIGLLPIMPEKAAAGLKQLGFDVAGKSLGVLFRDAPRAGHKLGEGSALFPRVETAK